MIDILMATYNGEKYVSEQIESIFAQTCKDWRLVIHDDRSKDATADVVRDVIWERENVCFSVNDVACGSAAGNFIGLLAEAKNDYVMFCDQDDVWHKDKVEKTLAAMENAEKSYGKQTPILVYTDLRVVDGDLNVLSDSFISYMNVPPAIILPRLLMQNSVTGCTVMMNRALYSLVQKAVDTKRMVMHDHFAALAASVFGKIVHVPEATMDYRQHGDNSVGAADGKSVAYLWKRFRRGKETFREDMKDAMIQAEYFAEIYGDQIKNKKKKALISGFANLQDAGKWARVKFYMKNRVIKYGWIRALMQMIWG